MVAPGDNQMLILKPSLRRWLVPICFFVIIGIVGSVMALRAEWVGWVGIALAIAGLPFCWWVLTSPRMWLKLDRECIRFGTLRRIHCYRWSDIAAIGVAWVAEEKVCFTFRANYQGEKKLRAINQASFGFDRFLPDAYGKKPRELAKLLEDWRHRCSGKDQDGLR